MQMESGIGKKNILILSSFLSNDGSSKMINDIVRSLGNDYNVDLLTKYPQKIDNIEVFSAYNKYHLFLHRSFNYLDRKLSRYKNLFFKKEIAGNNLPYYFFDSEESPPVNSKRLLKKIKKEYDFVFVFFWQGLLTSRTLKDIYCTVEKPFLLVAADMYPMTGGCSYFWDCNRLEKSCGKCPGISSTIETDITRKNFLIKKEMIQSINCIFLGNNWQINHANKSGIFKNLNTIYPIVDETVFRPRNKSELKRKFDLEDKIVLFFGSTGLNDPRKGYEYLMKSLQFLSEKKPDLLKNIVLVIAGKGGELAGIGNYKIKYTGYLTFDELAEYYAMADVFLSPTIQDAGPMMLNQALMCGTPAVAFEIGTACDIINETTGYLAKYRDSEDFCDGIIEVLAKSSIDFNNISKTCRAQSLERSSYKGFRDDVIKAYNQIKDK